MPWAMLLGMLIATVIAGYVIGLTVVAGDVRERTWAVVNPHETNAGPPEG
jgi:hypothetical protein